MSRLPTTRSTPPQSLLPPSTPFHPNLPRSRAAPSQKKIPPSSKPGRRTRRAFRNLDQASIPSWVPTLQWAPAPKPNRSPCAKPPYRKWARPTPGLSKSAALVTNKLAARRPRKTKKEWISQRERIGDCLRRIIEVRLAQITLLEAEVARLKMAISCCRGCAGGYWTSRDVAGECTARPPYDTLSLEWVPMEPSQW